MLPMLKAGVEGETLGRTDVDLPEGGMIGIEQEVSLLGNDHAGDP